MPIPKKKYIQLKAMYDFQRKISYNKEKLKKAIDVPSDWVPKDDKLKIEGEEWATLKTTLV